MRICDLSTIYIDGGEGGVNTYLREKARFLSSLGGAVEHLLILPARRTETRDFHGSTLRALGSPRLPWNPLQRLLINFPAIRRLLREFRPDVVEVDGAYLLGHLVRDELAGTGAAVVGFHHVHLPFNATLRWGPGGAIGQVSERFSWRYLDWCARPLDRLLVASSDILERLRARGFRGLELVPLGVNLDLFRPPAAPRATRPARTVLYVGRLNEEKDVRVLFYAYRLLSERLENLRLVVVGEGPQRPLAERFARSRDDVELRGLCPHGPEMARHYAEADVLAVPSQNETFGIAIVEALASGLPVVGISRGGPLDLITPEVGALARPGSPADLAEKLAAVLARGTHPGSREAAGRRCRRHVEERYSWDRTFRRLLEVYRTAGSSPRAASVPAGRRAQPADLAPAVESPVPT